VALLDHSGEEADERERVSGSEVGLEDGGDGLEADVGVLDARSRGDIDK
jgi:hypothetical protein